MAEVNIRVEAEVHPTETTEKVKTAITNMFGSIELHEEPQRIGTVLSGEAKSRESLENFRSILRRDRVRSAARKLLNINVKGQTVSFNLNKQVAYAGHVSFSQESAESPLGTIKVVIESENPRELVDWIAPKIS
jgi:predicted RNA binding protein with dsRBD fold (UPF0201 family)